MDHVLVAALVAQAFDILVLAFWPRGVPDSLRLIGLLVVASIAALWLVASLAGGRLILVALAGFAGAVLLSEIRALVIITSDTKRASLFRGMRGFSG